MAFVLDNADPSGQGMFSKAGRFTSEKHMIFLKKEEILTNQRKFLRVSNLPHIKLEEDDKPPEPKDEEQPRASTSPHKKFRPIVSLFEKTQSRDELHVSRDPKPQAPPIGFYNPKFKQVEKQALVLFNYKNEKKLRAELGSPKSNSMCVYDVKEFSREIPEKPKRKIVGPLTFAQQVSREDSSPKKEGPHEMRFTYIEFPPVSTKSHKILSPNISKSLGRDRSALYLNKQYSPDYAPNFEFGRKGLGSCGPMFNKVSQRKPMLNLTMTISDQLPDPNNSIRAQSRPIRTPIFKSVLSRESDPTSPLPSFMQKSVNSRISIGTLSQKTLEINNYSHGKFQSMTSSFNFFK
jgi:hypothetical protein